jgi:hypothetical protein
MPGKLGQWAGRLRGLTTPFGGASWVPLLPERDAAFRLLDFLEDRRVLYTPSYAETPRYCVESVIEIRHYITGLISELGKSGQLVDHLRAIRTACRHFTDRIRPDGDPDYDSMAMRNHCQSWDFQDALGQLRGIIGVHVAFIAARFDLDVKGGLKSILPPLPIGGSDE